MANQVNLNTKIITGKIRMSYVNLFTPRAVSEGEEPRYGLCVLIPKTDRETIHKINSAIDAAIKSGVMLWGGTIPPDLKTPLKDGDEERPDQTEYAGHYFINATSKIKPGVVDKKVKEITDPSEVYSGCYGKVSLNFYAFNYLENQGIGCGLLNVQKICEGEALSVRSRAEDDFTAVDDEEDILG